MRLAAKVLVSLNAIFPKPKRPFSKIDREKLVIRTNPGSSIEYLEIQKERAKGHFQSGYKEYLDFENKVILDLGCGFGGATLFYAQQDVRHVIGVDFENRFLVAGRKYLGDNYIEFLAKNSFVNCDANFLPFPSKTFDIVIANDFFEHVQNPRNTLAEIFRVLKDGGCYAFEFPAYFSARARHLNYTIYTPWCQVFFSDDTIREAAKEIAMRSDLFWIKEDPDGWDRRDRSSLNKLTINQFREMLIKQMDCKVIKLRYQNAHRVLQPLCYLFKINEYFTDHVQCILKKEVGACITGRDIRKHLVREFKTDLRNFVSLMLPLFWLKRRR